ncbi:fungal-specific transcription factor domain-containing protein [Lyophyllum atratum]|nr:fungal-specific transcription factor domain-containing protein [Lyophyllum atratum]
MSSSKPSPTTSASPPTSTLDPPNPNPNEKRVALACLRCRTKRARCSGDKPVCRACAKAREECEWPVGRRRKRTRREMEEEERRERLGQMRYAAGGDQIGPAPAPEKDIQSLMAWGRPDTLSVSPHAAEGMQWDFPASSVSPQLTWRSMMNASSGQGLMPSSSMLPQFAPADAREKDAAQLVRALESQVAFIDGDPTRNEDLELYYYRFQSGSTAIHPGVNRISLKLQPLPASSSPVSGFSAPLPVCTSPSGPTGQSELDVFDDNGLPYPHVYIPLLDTFFRTMSRHFPSISRRRMEERLETGTMSAFLLNCICALGARFHPSAQDAPLKACAPFITKAQELIIPLLHLPTTDVVTGLLLLAWANYGQNSESGLWQYSGMAIRMALDIGMHENSEIYENRAHLIRVRHLFWCLFVTDRILAFSTGRPPTISEDMIEVPLPVDEDFAPDPARSDADAAQELPQPTAFVYMVRLMVLCGRIASVLNGRRGRLRTLVTGPSMASPETLKRLQTELVQFYAELPDAMKWSVEAFKHQEARGHGDSFLTLHLWANAVLAMVFHPELMSKPSGIETPLSQNMDRSIKLSLSSSRIIAECLVFADLFASHSYTNIHTSTEITDPRAFPSLAFIHDMKNTAAGFNLQADKKPQTFDDLLSTLARQNLSVLTKAIQRMEHYWAGISYVSNILEQRAADSSLRASMVREAGGHSAFGLHFLSLPSHHYRRRHATDNPSPGVEPCSLDDLLNSYSIEGLFVQPADPFDLEGLLASGYDNPSNAATSMANDPNAESDRAGGLI